jgi:hypothetical protein
MELERKPALRAAPAHTVQYEQRRPEQTLLYRLVWEHLETFLAQVEARAGTAAGAFSGGLIPKARTALQRR